METEKTSYFLETIEIIRNELDKDIRNLHSEKNGIIVLLKNRIVSYNSVVGSFFSVTNNQDVSGMDISTVLHPDLITNRMLANEDDGNIFQKTVSIEDYSGMPVEISLLTFGYTKSGMTYNILVFERMADSLNHTRKSTQMINSVLSNISTFLREIQEISDEKDISRKLLNHMSVISKASVVFFGTFKNNTTMVMKDFIAGDSKYSYLQKELEFFKGLEMTPHEIAFKSLRKGKVHEAPLDLKELSFNMIDPVKAEKLTQMFRLLKVYSIGINFKEHLIGIFTFIYDSFPGQIYIPAIELYAQNISPYLYNKYYTVRAVKDTKILSVIESMHLPGAVVNEKENFINCNFYFERMLKIDEHESLVGKSTREITDRVEFDNFLTNIYMRKKKISGIYTSKLIDKEKQPVNVTILAGPYFENENFIGAFGIFLKMNPAEGNKDKQIMPSGIGTCYVICNIDGTIVETNCKSDVPNSHISSVLLDRVENSRLNYEDLHNDMKKDNLFLCGISTKKYKDGIIIFRLHDQKQEYFIYILSDDISIFNDNQIKFIKDFAESADLGLLIADTPSGKIEFVNEKMQNITGNKSGELKNKPHYSIFDIGENANTYKDFHFKIFAELNDGKSFKGQIRIKKGKNSHLNANVIAFKKLINNNLKYIFLISEGEENENEKHESLKQFDAIPKISYEAKTPLNNLLGLCQLASEETNILKKNELISSIFDNSVYLNKLYDDIWEIHKITNGTLPVSVSDIEPGQLLNTICENLNGILKNEKNNRLTVNLIRNENSEKTVFYSDSGKIIHIFNLLFGILAQVRKNGKVFFGIKDSGSKGNMSFFLRYESETQKQVFNNLTPPVHFLFERNDEVIDIQFRLCKLLIELLDGKYSFYSDYEYQEIDFTLPSRKKSKESSVLQSNQFKFSGQSLLIMTSDDSLKKILNEKLHEIGITTDFTHDGIKMLEKIRNNKYDLAILDLSNENLDGIETIWTLRHKGNKLPLIAIFEVENNNLREKCVKIGCNDFFTKPINESIMIHKLNRILIKK